MQTVVHAFNRGSRYVYVQDDGPNFGYSSRVAYAMGLDAPHYPVPATLSVSDTAVIFSHNAKAINQITVRYVRQRLRY